MKRVPIKLVVFITAFIAGITVAWTPLALESEQSFQPASAHSESPPVKADAFVPEFTNVSLPEEFAFYDLLTVYKGETSVGRMEMEQQGFNKSWLGLLKRGNQYSLEKRSAAVGKLIKSEFGDYYPIKFRTADKILFLIPDDEKVKAGSVTTLYLGPSDEDRASQNLPFLEMAIGFRQEFQLRGESYVLRVAPGISDDGFPLSVLVLEKGVKCQIVWYRPYNEASSPDAGNLDWVGDLDGDAKLDFMISSFAINGGYGNSFLFLSSSALPENLVAPYAYFSSGMY